MTDKDDTTLQQIFSSRSRSQRGSQNKDIASSSNSSQSSSPSSNRSTISSTNLSNRVGTSGETSNNVNKETSHSINPNKQDADYNQGSRGLSPIAEVVLSEARRELGGNVDLQRSQVLGKEIMEGDIAQSVDAVLIKRSVQLSDLERASVIVHLKKDLLGWGVLQPLIDNAEVTDIHCYDYQTVVLQRGKANETTALHWPTKQAYTAFIDRLLLKLGKSLSTQQHTVDAALPEGIRVCAVHESVCGERGPLLCLRVPRMTTVSLENLVSYGVAAPIMANYLAALVRSCLCTFIIAGETGTGKTTTLKCLASQFGKEESIVAVEDTPELNLDHPYFRCLVSRPANSEGVGAVSLSEHIKTTLRMTPTRVLLGEMRDPSAAEAFLESAQTGHVGMTTVHARNAKETLVRLESLLGRAQKSVSVEIIRSQIALAVDVVMWLYRCKETGRPRVGEIIEVGHYVEGAIQIRPMFKAVSGGKKPVWRLESWSSSFDDILHEYGIDLAQCPAEVSL